MIVYKDWNIFFIFTFFFLLCHFPTLKSCYTKESNDVIGQFAEFIGEENFDILTDVIDAGTDVVDLVGKVAGIKPIRIAASVAKFFMRTCIKNQQDDKLEIMLSALNQQIHKLEHRIEHGISDLKIVMHNIDFDNRVFLVIKKGLHRMIGYQQHQDNHYLESMKRFCRDSPPDEILNEFMIKLQEYNFGQKIIEHSGYDGEVYFKYRHKIDEAVKSILILLGYCIGLEGHQNITYHHFYTSTINNVNTFTRIAFNEDYILKNNYWPDSVNRLVIKTLEHGENVDNEGVKDDLVSELHRKHPWANFTVIVYDAIRGFEKHKYSHIPSETLHVFRHGGKNCIVFKSYNDRLEENIIKLSNSTKLESLQYCALMHNIYGIACTRMRILQQILYTDRNIGKELDGENYLDNKNEIVENKIIRSDYFLKRSCVADELILKMFNNVHILKGKYRGGNFKNIFLDKLYEKGVLLLQAMVDLDSNPAMYLSTNAFEYVVKQKCTKYMLQFFRRERVKKYLLVFYSYIPQSIQTTVLHEYKHEIEEKVWDYKLRRLQFIREREDQTIGESVDD